MKWVIIASVVVTACIAIAVFYFIHKRNEKDSEVGSGGSLSQNHTDVDIINLLPNEFKEKIISVLGALPTELTADWLLNDLMAGVCCGDAKEVQKFLDAFIIAGNGCLRCAASVGDVANMQFMEPYEELPADYIVKKVICSGLVRTKTGEVLLKAVVA